MTNTNTNLKAVTSMNTKGLLTLGTTLALLGWGSTTLVAHADTKPTTANSTSTQRAMTNNSKESQSGEQTKYSPEQQALINSVQNKVNNDKTAITAKNNTIISNTNDVAQQTQVITNTQQQILNTENSLTTAKTQLANDQKTAQSLSPAGYQPAQNSVSTAQQNVAAQQNAVNIAQQNVKQTQQAMSNASESVSLAQTKVQKANKEQATASSAVSVAHQKVTTTPTTVTVHHPAEEAQPGTLQNGTVINSENQLPNHLIKPVDADQYNSYDKQTSAGANLNSYWNYVGADDHSEKIVNDKLTTAQQTEASQYALTLINDFRKQHGLTPMKLSTTSIQLAQDDANTRIENNVDTFNHSYSGSDTQGGITVEQWDNGVIRKIDPAFNTADDQAKNYFIDDQNLGSIDMTYTPTMLALKVRILQIVQDMAFADAEWNWAHTNAFLRTQPNIIGTTDTLDNIWFGLNVVSPDSSNESAVVFDMFENWDTDNNQTSIITNALNKNLMPGFVNTGYNTQEKNPAYLTALKDLKKAETNSTSIQTTLNLANKNFATEKDDYSRASQAYFKALSKLQSSTSSLNNSRSMLTKAQEILSTLQNSYKQAMVPYTVALNKVQDDKTHIAALQNKLSKLKHQLSIESVQSEQKQKRVQQLQSDLKQLNHNLTTDEIILQKIKNGQETYLLRPEVNSKKEKKTVTVSENDKTTASQVSITSNKAQSSEFNLIVSSSQNINAQSLDSQNNRKTSRSSRNYVAEAKSVPTRMQYYHFIQKKQRTNEPGKVSGQQKSLPQTNEEKGAILLSLSGIGAILGAAVLLKKVKY